MFIIPVVITMKEQQTNELLVVISNVHSSILTKTRNDLKPAETN